MNEATRARFLASVDRRGDDECWPWIGTRTSDGYGQFYWTPEDAPWVTPGGHRRRRRQSCTTASRAAFMLATGIDPAGFEVCHECDNPPCCNPAHLWLGSKADNQHDSLAKGRRGKLSFTAATEIRASDEHAEILALAYGVTPSMIAKVRAGTSWVLDRAA